MRVKKSWSMCGAAMAAVLGLADPVSAGECTMPDSHYVSILEAGPGHPEFPDFWCLQRACFIETPLWAGKAHAARFAAARADTLVPRIRDAARRLLALPEARGSEWRRAVLEVAAAHGLARLDSLDVFAELFPAGHRFSRQDYALVAVLQDCRGVGILRSRYLALREDPDAEGWDEPVHVLSCLYHLPCEEALALAKDLYATETDEHLSQRVQRVMERKP